MYGGSMTEAPHVTTPDAAAAPDAEEALAAALHAVVVRLRRLGERGAQVEPLPLSEIEVLTWVAEHPGTTVTGMARALGLQHSNVSATVRRLVGRGLVERREDPEDARRTRVHPTERASADKRAIDAAWTRDVRVLLDTLPADERAAVVAAAPALAHLAQAWSLTRGTAGPV